MEDDDEEEDEVLVDLDGAGVTGEDLGALEAPPVLVAVPGDLGVLELVVVLLLLVLVVPLVAVAVLSLGALVPLTVVSSLGAVVPVVLVGAILGALVALGGELLLVLVVSSVVCEDVDLGVLRGLSFSSSSSPLSPFIRASSVVELSYEEEYSHMGGA